MSTDAEIRESLESLPDDDLHNFDQDMIRHFNRTREYINVASRSLDPHAKWRREIVNQVLRAVVLPHVRAFVCRRLDLPTTDDLQMNVALESLQIAKDAKGYAKRSNWIAAFAIIVAVVLGILGLVMKDSGP